MSSDFKVSFDSCCQCFKLVSVFPRLRTTSHGNLNAPDSVLWHGKSSSCRRLWGRGFDSGISRLPFRQLPHERWSIHYQASSQVQRLRYLDLHLQQCPHQFHAQWCSGQVFHFTYVQCSYWCSSSTEIDHLFALCPSMNRWSWVWVQVINHCSEIMNECACWKIRVLTSAEFLFACICTWAKLIFEECTGVALAPMFIELVVFEEPSNSMIRWKLLCVAWGSALENPVQYNKTDKKGSMN